jgi:hypothetical protein
LRALVFAIERAPSFPPMCPPPRSLPATSLAQLQHSLLSTCPPSLRTLVLLTLALAVLTLTLHSLR